MHYPLLFHCLECLYLCYLYGYGVWWGIKKRVKKSFALPQTENNKIKIYVTIPTNGGYMTIKAKGLISTQLSVVGVSNVISEYQKETQYPTFSGLLVRLGITWREYNEMTKSENPKVQKAVRVMELFKQHLESKMEEMLIYQQNLPKFYNHNSLMFAMKKSNPLRYGDKVVEVVSTNKSGNINLDALENESGISIKEGVKS